MTTTEIQKGTVKIRYRVNGGLIDTTITNDMGQKINWRGMYPSHFESLTSEANIKHLPFGQK